jgi:hypothetical protein
MPPADEPAEPQPEDPATEGEPQAAEGGGEEESPPAAEEAPAECAAPDSEAA